jgi:hypothetical protein
MTQLTRPGKVDDYLGPGANRFFGAGYKRANQRLTGIVVDIGADGAGTARAEASVDYPPDWSRKGSTDQLPHLSSIDVLLIGGEIAEAYLTRALDLSVTERAALRLRKVRLQAGSSPVEEELAAFPVRARIGAPAPLTGWADTAVSVVDCQVGKLRARLEVLHAAKPPAPRVARYADADAALGAPHRRPYAAAHRDKTQTVDGIQLDLAARTATARLAASWTTPDELRLTGLDSGAHRGITAVDVFVAAIQLGQILLYELDGLSRADSNTLWMRQTTIVIGAPGRPGAGPGTLRVRLADAELLTAGDGGQWRSARIEADFDHFAIACAVAHRLPTLTGRKRS